MEGLQIKHQALTNIQNNAFEIEFKFIFTQKFVIVIGINQRILIERDLKKKTDGNKWRWKYSHGVNWLFIYFIY